MRDDLGIVFKKHCSNISSVHNVSVLQSFIPGGEEGWRPIISKVGFLKISTVLFCYSIEEIISSVLNMSSVLKTFLLEEL